MRDDTDAEPAAVGLGDDLAASQPVGLELVPQPEHLGVGYLDNGPDVVERHEPGVADHGAVQLVVTPDALGSGGRRR